jgi:hypothetical protein
MRKVINLAVLFMFIINMTGCATIVNGGSRKINVVTNPSGATVTIDKRTRISPAEFSTSQWKNGYLVKITKEGYEPIEVDIEHRLSGWIFCNIFFGPGMFVAFPIDFASGNAWNFTPMNIEETLTPIQVATQPAKK